MKEEFFQAIEGIRDVAPKTGKSIRCNVEHCGLPATCFLEREFLCLNHFITRCYQRLKECGATPFADSGPAAFETNDRFLKECAERAANLVHPIRGLDNLDRARLFDIFLWATELLAKRGVFEKPAPASGMQATDEQRSQRAKAASSGIEDHQRSEEGDASRRPSSRELTGEID
jgi:hypothetical protein